MGQEKGPGPSPSEAQFRDQMESKRCERGSQTGRSKQGKCAVVKPRRQYPAVPPGHCHRGFWNVSRVPGGLGDHLKLSTLPVYMCMGIHLELFGVLIKTLKNNVLRVGHLCQMLLGGGVT